MGAPERWRQQRLPLKPAASLQNAPGTPTSELDGGSLSAAAVGAAPFAPPSLADLLQHLMAQNERVGNMMEMMQYRRKNGANDKSHLANVRLDEKYFRNVGGFNNLRSGGEERCRQFLNAVRECDVDFADMVEGFEKFEEPIDHIQAYTLTQNQLSTNMYNRLIGLTTGTAFQIVESVPCHNGGEAWRLRNLQVDPKTDARLTNLVLSVIGHKIKAKDVQAGLILWEAQLLALERDRQEVLSSKTKRAFLMIVLPPTIQTRTMEHLDRLKTYKEVRDKVVSICHNIWTRRHREHRRCQPASLLPKTSGKVGGKVITSDGKSLSQPKTYLSRAARRTSRA